jgi:hypothetical protein
MERGKEGQEEDLQDSLINGGGLMIRTIVCRLRCIGAFSLYAY